MARPGRAVLQLRRSTRRAANANGASPRDAGAPWLARGDAAVAAAGRAAGGGTAQCGQCAGGRRACATPSASPMRPIASALRAFKGLPHRVEKSPTIDGVDLLRRFQGHQRRRHGRGARAACTQPVVLIAGGDGKGQDFAPLRGRCSAACARGGADRPRCASRSPRRSTDCGVPHRTRGDMDDAVRCAPALAAAGRRRAAVAGLRELRHVPQLRASRRGVRRRGAASWRR